MKTKPNILLVDDRAENLIALEGLLGDHDVNILKAQRGEQALELLLTHDVALALLDVQMPGMDGFELAELMRGAVRTREIPIIFITAALHDPGRVFQGYESGAVDFLSKPLEPRILSSKVSVFLQLHRQRQELVEAQQRLRALMDAVPIGISFSIDASCEYVTGNPAALAQFEATSADNLSSTAPERDAPGRRVRYTHGGKDLPASEFPMQRAAAERRAVGPIELGVQLPSGRQWVAEASAAPVYDDQDRIIGCVAVTVDITARKRIENLLHNSRSELAAALKASQQAVLIRDQVVSMVSHDLRNPLSAIAMQTALLRQQATRRELDPRTLEVALARIERGTTKMDNIISELTDAARLQAGERLTLTVEDTDLAGLADSVAAEHQQGARNHTLVVRRPPSPVVGRWDRGRIERVLDNLVSNAIKYSPGGGTIAIEVDVIGEEPRHWARLRVCDEGVGIPADALDVVFEWFARADNVAGRIGGTGIGLASARRIVEEHGGMIAVDSEEGRGSTFTVQLPLQQR